MILRRKFRPSRVKWRSQKENHAPRLQNDTKLQRKQPKLSWINPRFLLWGVIISKNYHKWMGPRASFFILYVCTQHLLHSLFETYSCKVVHWWIWSLIGSWRAVGWWLRSHCEEENEISNSPKRCWPSNYNQVWKKSPWWLEYWKRINGKGGSFI